MILFLMPFSILFFILSLILLLILFSIVTVPILPPRSAREVTTILSAVYTFRSRPVTSMNRSRVPWLTLVRCPLIIGGNESTWSLASSIRGYLSNPSMRCAYFTPFGWRSSISCMVMGSSKSRGTKLKSGSAATYLNGGSISLISCMPMETFLRSLPRPQCRSS